MHPSRHNLRIWLSLAPTLVIVGGLVAVSLAYGLAQSIGLFTGVGAGRVSLAAYRSLLLSDATPAAREFWPALGFSLWISLASTGIAALGALMIAALLSGRGRQPRGTTLLLINLNLAFPHLVWAVALSLILAQSGLLARGAFALGLLEAPSQFPILVRDRYGLGIILHYASKEIPFLLLIVLAVLRTHGAPYDLVAENLGASPWQRLRYVTLPLVLPALSAGAALAFAFSFGAYEVPALLGVRYPRMLAVLALDLFVNADLRHRSEAMALSLVMSLITLLVVLVGSRAGKR